MDRSLKWRTLALFGALVFCVCTLAPSFAPKDSLPSWFTRLFSKRINLGLDLQGGLHIVYSIDLAQAVDDKASDNKRDLEAQFADTKTAATVKVPAASLDVPHGSFTVNLVRAPGLLEMLSSSAADDPDSFNGYKVKTVDPRGLAVLWQPVPEPALRSRITRSIAATICRSAPKQTS